MKKTTATLVLVVLVALTAFGWISVVNNQARAGSDLAEYISKADGFAQKGIYYDALVNYQAALELSPEDYTLATKVAEMEYGLGDYAAFITACDSAIAIDVKAPEAYLKKIEYYMSTEQYTEALAVVRAAQGENIESDELAAFREDLKTRCIRVFLTYKTVGDWHGGGNGAALAAAEDNGVWGIIDSAGDRKVSLGFTSIGAYDSAAGVIPVEVDSEWYYVDMEGRKRLAGDKPYQYLGSFGQGLAPAEYSGVYGYIDKDFNEKRFEFDYAGAFARGVAAVEKGGKWALIDTDLKEITGYDYDEILVDSYGFCSVFGAVAARTGDTWSLLDTKGAVLFGGFEGVAMPASRTEPVAVKSGGLWGFVDREGNTVIEPRFEDAGSFSLGMAPVMVDGLWGYVSAKGEIVVEPKYRDATVFSPDGAAMVGDTASYSMLILCEYYDE